MSNNNNQNFLQTNADTDFERNIHEDLDESGSFIKMDGFDEPSQIHDNKTSPKYRKVNQP